MEPTVRPAGYARATWQLHSNYMGRSSPLRAQGLWPAFVCRWATRRIGHGRVPVTMGPGAHLRRRALAAGQVLLDFDAVAVGVFDVDGDRGTALAPAADEVGAQDHPA